MLGILPAVIFVACNKVFVYRVMCVLCKVFMYVACTQTEIEQIGYCLPIYTCNTMEKIERGI